MGAQQSDLQSSTMMNFQRTIPFTNNQASPHKHNHKSPRSLYSRLDSIGEDTHVLRTGQSSPAAALKANQTNQTLAKSFASIGNTWKSRRAAINHTILSNSVNIPLSPMSRKQRQHQFLKSHSLSEIALPSHKKIMYSSNMSTHRSWSVGSSDSKSVKPFEPRSQDCLRDLEFLPGLISAMSASFDIVCDAIRTEDMLCDNIFAASCVGVSSVQSNSKDSCKSENSDIITTKNMDSEMDDKKGAQEVTQDSWGFANSASHHSFNDLPSSCEVEPEMDRPSERPVENGQVKSSHLHQSNSGEEKYDIKESNVLSSSEPKNKIVNLTATVLFSPRKKSKKGRPSSKKQKKRQREKLKHAQNPVEQTKCESLSNCNSDIESSLDVSKLESDISFSIADSKSNNDGNRVCSPKISTPVKPTSSPFPCEHSLFISAASSSDSDDADCDEDDDDDWSVVDESEDPACLSPVAGVGFSFALNLDSIFKQKPIPSLSKLMPDEVCAEDSHSETSTSHSPLKPNANGLHLTVTSLLSLSDDDSVEFAVSSPPVVDLSAAKRPRCDLSQSPQMPPRCDFTSFDAECSTDEDLDLEDDSYHELVDIPSVNAMWELVYSSPDSCCCCHIKEKKGVRMADGSQARKVRFEEEPKLWTLHHIGDEDRAGTWHHYALDRERFERRILEAGRVISPVLDPEHRAKVLERNTNSLASADHSDN